MGGAPSCPGFIEAGRRDEPMKDDLQAAVSEQPLHGYAGQGQGYGQQERDDDHKAAPAVLVVNCVIDQLEDDANDHDKTGFGSEPGQSIPDGC